VDPFSTIVLPLALWGLAYGLGRREWRHYKASDEIGTDLFVYSRGRLWRRMTGVGMLVALGLTLAALGLFPARSPQGLSIYMAVLITEVLVLLLLPLFDLWETARTARPHDLTRQGGPPKKTKAARGGERPR